MMKNDKPPLDENSVLSREDSLRNIFAANKHLLLFCNACKAKTRFKSCGLGGATSQAVPIRGLQVMCTRCNSFSKGKKTMLHLVLKEAAIQDPADEAITDFADQVQAIMRPIQPTSRSNPIMEAFSRTKRPRTSSPDVGTDQPEPELEQTTPIASPNLVTQVLTGADNHLLEEIRMLKDIVNELRAEMSLLRDENRSLRAKVEASSTQRAPRPKISTPPTTSIKPPAAQDTTAQLAANSTSNDATRSYAQVARIRPQWENRSGASRMRIAQRALTARTAPTVFKRTQFKIHDTRPLKMARTGREAQAITRDILRLIGINGRAILASKVGNSVVELYHDAQYTAEIEEALKQSNLEAIETDPLQIPDFVIDKDTARQRQLMRLSRLYRQASTRNLQHSVISLLAPQDQLEVQRLAGPRVTKGMLAAAIHGPQASPAADQSTLPETAIEPHHLDENMEDVSVDTASTTTVPATQAHL